MKQNTKNTGYLKSFHEKQLRDANQRTDKFVSRIYYIEQEKVNLLIQIHFLENNYKKLQNDC